MVRTWVFVALVIFVPIALLANARGARARRRAAELRVLAERQASLRRRRVGPSGVSAVASGSADAVELDLVAPLRRAGIGPVTLMSAYDANDFVDLPVVQRVSLPSRR